MVFLEELGMAHAGSDFISAAIGSFCRFWIIRDPFRQVIVSVSHWHSAL